MRIYPISNIDDKAALRSLVNLIVRQVSDTTGTITLSPVASTTTIKSPKLLPQSVVHLIPRTEAASNAKYWVSVKSIGEAIISHTTGSDLTFDYVIIGSA